MDKNEIKPASEWTPEETSQFIKVLHEISQAASAKDYRSKKALGIKSHFDDETLAEKHLLKIIRKTKEEARKERLKEEFEYFKKNKRLLQLTWAINYIHSFYRFNGSEYTEFPFVPSGPWLYVEFLHSGNMDDTFVFSPFNHRIPFSLFIQSDQHPHNLPQLITSKEAIQSYIDRQSKL